MPTPRTREEDPPWKRQPHDRRGAFMQTWGRPQSADRGRNREPSRERGRGRSRERSRDRREHARRTSSREQRRGSSPAARRPNQSETPGPAKKPSVFARLGSPKAAATARGGLSPPRVAPEDTNAAVLDPPGPETPADRPRTTAAQLSVSDLLLQLQEKTAQQQTNAEAKLNQQLQVHQQYVLDKDNELQAAKGDLATVKEQLDKTQAQLSKVQEQLDKTQQQLAASQGKVQKMVRESEDKEKRWGAASRELADLRQAPCRVEQLRGQMLSIFTGASLQLEALIKGGPAALIAATSADPPEWVQDTLARLEDHQMR